MIDTYYSLYVHIPFCRSRCNYCDFNTFAGQQDSIQLYIQALCREVMLLTEAVELPIKVHTVFFGGGTPSLIPASYLERVIHVIKQSFDLKSDCEITLEANPGTLTFDQLKHLRRMGFNRISMGMQSAHPLELKLLGRCHSYFEVVQAVKWARHTGFENLSLDLIFGIPHQTLKSWQNSVELALSLEPEHISMYALTLEKDTPLYSWVARGLVAEPDDDLAADMYEWASLRLQTAGFSHYEISNWAFVSQTGKILTCLHNLQYWHNFPYLGFGCAAHGYAGGYRVANVSSIPDYINNIMGGNVREFPLSPATVEINQINRLGEMEETMMLGLRLVQEGVSNQTFNQRFGLSLMHAFGDQINQLCHHGLLEFIADGERVRLTPRGRLLGNQVFMQFVGGAAKS